MSTQPVPLTDANFETEALQASQPVLVDFYADWCGPCQALTPVLAELASDFEGRAVIGKVDVDAAPALASRYGVRSIPTLVILQNGEEVDRIVGLTTKRALAEKLDSLPVSR
ncbi:MAG: thioredoxin [Planctomycetota bacterium]